MATAFHRNTQTNNEGGTIDEEFRIWRWSTVSTPRLRCGWEPPSTVAQCHTHKYDPITQEEYYRLFAIFNQTEDSDKGDSPGAHGFRRCHQTEKGKSQLANST